MNVTLHCTSLHCDCGEPVSVTERAAGLRFPCRCGRSITVPSLGRLRELAGEPAVPLDPVAEVAHALSAGILPPRDCIGCGRSDADLIEITAVCERKHASTAGGDSGPSITAYLLLGCIGSALTSLARRQAADVEWHGRETVVPMPVRVCDTCRSDYGLKGPLPLPLRRSAWKRFLARVLQYGAVLAKFPDAALTLQRPGRT